MANGKTICFSKEILEREGVVVLPLRKWRVIEDNLEDLDVSFRNSGKRHSQKEKREEINPLRESIKKI